MFERLHPHLAEMRSGSLSIWEHPRDGAEYVIGVDTATGKVKDIGATRMKPGSQAANQQRDFSASVVIELESAQHVATLHGHIDPLEFSSQSAMLGKYYNQAILVVETNGVGIATIENLQKVIEYPNLYRSMVINRIDPSDMFATQWGFNTSAQTRPVLMNQIRDLLGSRAPFTQDKRLVDELRTMQIDPSGVPRAMGRDKDDMVLALSLALQGRFERLNGTLNEPNGREHRMARLSPEDRYFYEQVQKRHEELNNGSSASNRIGGYRRGGLDGDSLC